ncbi:MAG: type II toxin-antitoxin system VapC family toxin [Desulfomonilaceae bacterium]
MILVDTGPLVAFFDASDNYHQICLDVLKQLDEPLLTVWPVLTEAIYLLNFSWKAQDNLWEFLARGAMEIVHPERREMERCRVLMNKYKDLPMDLADAAMVAIAERKKIKKIFTLDHRHFSVYRPLHVKEFELIPEQWP